MMDVYGAVYRRVLFPAWEGVLRGRSTLEHLRWLEQTQWRSADELAALQLGALRQLLRHAWTQAPFYRKRMEAAGVTPEKVRSVEDLARLPILTREQAQAVGEERVATSPPTDIRKSTSGTLGKPLVFGYDRESEYWRQAVKWRGYAWAGYRPGDRSLHFWGGLSWPPPPRKKKIKIAVDRALRRERYFDCTLRGEKELEDVVSVLRRERPQVLLCYTQAGVDLARFINERGLRDWDTIPVICGAERLFAADRVALDNAFGAVFETYGCREVMLIASECEAHAGMHLSAENLLVEIVVTENGRQRAAKPGEVGEVVVTDLHNYGMPFIRYANGDLAVAGPSEPCACGRTLPRLSAVEGRVTETLRNGAGAQVSGLIFNVIFAGALAQRVRQFQVVQHRDGAVTLKLVPVATGSFDDAARDHIVKNVAKYLTGVEVRTQVVSEIPLTKTGKRQVVVVER